MDGIKLGFQIAIGICLFIVVVVVILLIVAGVFWIITLPFQFAAFVGEKSSEHFPDATAWIRKYALASIMLVVLIAFEAYWLIEIGLPEFGQGITWAVVDGACIGWILYHATRRSTTKDQS